MFFTSSLEIKFVLITDYDIRNGRWNLLEECRIQIQSINSSTISVDLKFSEVDALGMRNKF